MGGRFSASAIKERIKEACKWPWVRLRRHRNPEPQHPERLEITVTHTITQRSDPISPPPDNGPEGRVRSRCPSLLTINSAAGISPSGSPAGVALGIPAEHILEEENPGPVPPLNFSRPAMGHSVEITAGPATPTKASKKKKESGNGSNPFESPAAEPSGSESPAGSPAAQPPASQPQAEATPATDAAAKPSAADGGGTARRTGDLDAITLAPPLDQKPPVPEQVVDVGKPAVDTTACSLCRLSHLAPGPANQPPFREHMVYLPCRHSFGHRCLYRWMTNLQRAGRHCRCPRDCIALHHCCGHLTMPVRTEPNRSYHDTSTTVIPWVCEFCESPDGSRLRTRLEQMRQVEGTTRANVMRNRELRGGNLKKVFNVIRGRHYPFAERVHLSMRQERQRAEIELHRTQAVWWIETWEALWGIEARA
ncbi:zinc finger protein [Trichoderma cornu-damae]|uniref:Zinc finger protein n=1 Tax=Trichoderma cornu-damae TaxID=654480 RepID=A0A9P8QU65_9HYPO|nr:zinc finger protein [Trichoderma cornu-damae]